MCSNSYYSSQPNEQWCYQWELLACCYLSQTVKPMASSLCFSNVNNGNKKCTWTAFVYDKQYGFISNTNDLHSTELHSHFNDYSLIVVDLLCSLKSWYLIIPPGKTIWHITWVSSQQFLFQLMTSLHSLTYFGWKLFFIIFSVPEIGQLPPSHQILWYSAVVKNVLLVCWEYISMFDVYAGVS